MIIALFIFTILNYYTFAFDLPTWFNIISLIAQLGCIMVAQAKWEKWKCEVEMLNKRITQYEKKKK